MTRYELLTLNSIDMKQTQLSPFCRCEYYQEILYTEQILELHRDKHVCLQQLLILVLLTVLFLEKQTIEILLSATSLSLMQIRGLLLAAFMMDGSYVIDVTRRLYSPSLLRQWYRCLVRSEFRTNKCFAHFCINFCLNLFHSNKVSYCSSLYELILCSCSLCKPDINFWEQYEKYYSNQYKQSTQYLVQLSSLREYFYIILINTSSELHIIGG